MGYLGSFIIRRGARMKMPRYIVAILALLLVSACNNTSRDQWKTIADTDASRFERAKAICNGRAAHTQVVAGRRWIAGAIAADVAFDGCMAEQGFAKKQQ
ncbi:hypothetical protein [Nitratireductor sp. ZSWI3]|uniref:hypothetical protein n=1 Tax=Nitratireductor sp. ZSWI3 TaxID=2966359 RepID=UPI0021505678|nr:hypothetical protein [Nitratireductor sp. ZSWI3]MCR4268810.1 hypothetical protein [Nitratireductor sp. ZSWI3]